MKWWIDDVAGGGMSRERARISIVHAIPTWFADHEAPVESTPSSRMPDRATWGLLPEHQSGAGRALRLIPGGEV